MQALIPDKLFFKIGEVAELLSVRPSVLRYWETEFLALAPAKSRSGQRLYSRKHVELAFVIKRLLYSEKITIEGAKRRLKMASKEGTIEGDATRSILDEIKADLVDIRDSLVSEKNAKQ